MTCKLIINKQSKHSTLSRLFWCARHMSFGANHGALPTHGFPPKIYGSTEKNMTVRWEGGGGANVSWDTQLSTNHCIPPKICQKLTPQAE